MLGNECESAISVDDSDVEKSKGETSRLPIPDIERPSTSKELGRLLADEEFDTDNESERFKNLFQRK